jgi:hypothetical protein
MQDDPIGPFPGLARERPRQTAVDHAGSLTPYSDLDLMRGASRGHARAAPAARR